MMEKAEKKNRKRLATNDYQKDPEMEAFVSIRNKNNAFFNKRGVRVGSVEG